MTARPGRRMPIIRVIARFHDMPEDRCWRCGRIGYVQRAHIVDRWLDGLDRPQNLALLCGGCHVPMPIIRPEQWREGLRYVGLHETAERLV